MAADGERARWARAQRERVERRGPSAQRTSGGERGALVRGEGGLSLGPRVLQRRRARRRARRGSARRAKASDRARRDRRPGRDGAREARVAALRHGWHKCSHSPSDARSGDARILGGDGRGRAQAKGDSLRQTVVRGCRDADRRNKKTFCFNWLDPLAACRRLRVGLWMTKRRPQRALRASSWHARAHRAWAIRDELSQPAVSHWSHRGVWRGDVGDAGRSGLAWGETREPRCRGVGSGALEGARSAP